MKKRLASGNGEKRGFFLPVAHSAFRQEGRARPRAACLAAGALTPARDRGMMKAPNDDGRNRRLSLAPQGEKILFAHTAITHTLAGTVSGGWCAYIGRVQRPGRREAPAAHRQPGSVVTLPFSFKTQNDEVLFMTSKTFSFNPPFAVLAHSRPSDIRIPADVSDDFRIDFLKMQGAISFLYCTLRNFLDGQTQAGHVVVPCEAMEGLTLIVELLHKRMDELGEEVRTDDD